MRLIETDTLSNQNISSALEIGSYTADAARAIMVRVFADQVAGGGDYVVYATLQLAGAGSAYRVIPVTTATAASGVTAICMTSALIQMANTDVLKVYLTGLAGDTTTPDTRVEFWEDDSLRPTTPDMMLDVSATGEAGLDFNNVKVATVATTLTNITVPTVTAVTNGVGLADDAITSAKFDESTAFPVKLADTGSTKIARTGADGDTLEDLSDQIDGVSTLGAGAISHTVTITDGSNPIDGVEVWITTDAGGSNVVAKGETDASGNVTFMLDAGTYYCWKQLSGYSFTNPETLVVS